MKNRIMIVDDEDDINFLFKTVLEDTMTLKSLYCKQIILKYLYVYIIIFQIW